MTGTAGRPGVSRQDVVPEGLLEVLGRGAEERRRCRRAEVVDDVVQAAEPLVRLVGERAT